MARLNHAESLLQIACVDWFNYQYPGIVRCFLFGAKRWTP